MSFLSKIIQPTVSIIKSFLQNIGLIRTTSQSGQASETAEPSEKDIKELPKFSITPITSGYRSSEGLNANFAAIQEAFENTLSRDGTSPNQMEGDLDMNGNKILNLPTPTQPNDPVRLQDIIDIEAGDFEVTLGIDDSITDGITDRAPSQNAVYDALALKANDADLDALSTTVSGKANVSHTHATSDITGLSTSYANISLSNVSNGDFATKAAAAGVGGGGGASVADSIADGVTTIAPSQNAVYDALQLKAATNLANVTNADFLAKATAAGVTAGSGAIVDFVSNYGGVGDGATNNLTAWNNLVADINSGTVRSVYIPPGNFYINGATTQITKGCEIYGAGPRISILTDNGGSSIFLDYFNINGLEHIHLHSLSLWTNQASIRQAIRLHYDPASSFPYMQRVHLRNLDICGTPGSGGAYGWDKGIESWNLVGAKYENVFFVGQISSDSESVRSNATYAFYNTASPGLYSVECRFIGCMVASAEYCWKGDGHLEGFVWDNCNPVFAKYGIVYSITDTSFSPYFTVQNSQFETYREAIQFSNAAYVTVSDSTFLTDPINSGSCKLISLSDVSTGFIHDNTFFGGASGSALSYGLYVTGASAYIKSHHNRYVGMNGAGIVFTGQAQECESINDTCDSFAGSGSAYVNDGTNQATNKRRGMKLKFMPLTQVDKGTNKLGSAVSLTTTATNWAGVGMNVVRGDKVRITWHLGTQSPSVAEQTVYMQIREYNHRPSSASPWQVISLAVDRNQIIETQTQGGATLAKGCYFSGSCDVDIIATTPDAYFVISPFVDSGSCSLFDCQLQVELL